MSRFIDEHRGRFGVEPICRVLGVSASTYYHRATGGRSRRVVEDEWLLEQIARVHAVDYHAYDCRRTWLALGREGIGVGRDRVKRLMRREGIQGAKRRGKPWRTTRPDPTAMRPPGLVVESGATPGGTHAQQPDRAHRRSTSRSSSTRSGHWSNPATQPIPP